jgi:hypothetical protein
MYPISSSSSSEIRGEHCPYCDAPSIRVAASLVKSHVKLYPDDVVFQCVQNPQHFVHWRQNDFFQQGKIANPYLRACRYALQLNLEEIFTDYGDDPFVQDCVHRYINFKCNNGFSHHLNIQLLSVQDCFKIQTVIKAAEWEKLIPIEALSPKAASFGVLDTLLKRIIQLPNYIEPNYFEYLYEELALDISCPEFINKTLEMIDYFRNCGDEFLRIVPAQCAVCFAHTGAKGYLFIGNRSWNYTGFVFHYNNENVIDFHDCKSMVHACQHLPLRNKYSFRFSRVVINDQIFN